MGEVEHQQDNPSQDWQKADARILGQILAAQNVVFALPDTIRIAEFYAQILISIPGITACRVCLAGKSVQAGEMASGVCAGCETLRAFAWEDDTPVSTNSDLRCNLAGQPDMRVIPIDSYQHRFGFFVFKVNQAAMGAEYQPFISNLSNYIALILENRWQKYMLQKAHDELERKVEERTHDLTAANEALSASRLAALDMMKEAVEARQRAEKASADLQREVAEHKRVEQEYRTLIKSVPDLIVRYDLDLRRIYVNPAWEKASGLSAAEVIGVAYTDIPKVPSPVNVHYVKKLRLALETGVSQIAEFTWVNASGVELFLEYAIVPEYDHHGRIAGLLAVGRDITERKRAEEKLKISEERLRMTLEATQIGIWDWDVANDRYYASPIYYTMLGYEPKEGPADRDEWVQRVHPDDKEAVLEQVDKVLSRTCNEYSYEARFRHADGSYRWQWALGYGAHYDKNENLTRMLGLRIDIDKRKRMEDELAAYREHLEELVRERTAELEEARNKARQYLDIAGVILVAIDTHRRVTLINQKGCEVLQSSSAEIIGKDWFETFVPANVRQDVIQGFGRLMAGELEPVEYMENPVLTRGGQERLVAWHNVLLRDGEGQITGTLSSGEDITERRRAEKQIINLNQDLQKRADALEAANKELDAFAYSVSHDLRAPLRHIDGFLELLQKKAGTALDERSRHYMDTISEAAQKMGLLIDDLLSFSRMGRQAMSLRQVELGNLVREVIRELEPDAAGRDVVWRIGDLPAVDGDASMLRIVLGNLIANALKFTRLRQQAQIEIGSLPGQPSEAVIFVRDNGVGFEMAYADKLFGVFQRLHRADEFEGTGIGLASVRRIIARHGGRTWAQGELDQGAAFFFSLPQISHGDGDEKDKAHPVG